MPVSSRYRAAPRITELGEGFYDEVAPARFPKHVLRFRNDRAAEAVGLHALDEGEWETHFARFAPLPVNLARPLALRYHGHQFDVYNPHLGDGRGFLFAQLLDADGRLLDLGTKGSGTTPYSRGGDGRLTLKGGVREVLATEMLEALGVETSKSLSLFETGEALLRSDEPSPTRSSVLVRLSHSHVRFGTFQRLAYERDPERTAKLLSYVVQNHFAHVRGEASASEGPDGVARFLSEVTRSSARFAAGLMVAGFVHGVLNSDNMSITGESFDYGPYRFLPTYDVDFVAAYFDHQGLYAYGRQPRAVFRNVVRLAEALRALAPRESLAGAMADFEAIARQDTVRRVLARLGLVSRGDADPVLVSAVHAFLAESRVGYDRFFFDWRGGLQREGRARSGASKAQCSGPAWDALRAALAPYEPVPGALGPYFDREQPCTLLIDEIEAIWQAIAGRDDWAPFHAKIRDIREMGAALAGAGAATRFDDSLACGARLFDAGSFFEAHEAWEAIWRIEADAGRRVFVQGLIQAAAAFHKTHAGGRGAIDGGGTEAALRLLAKALAKLEGTPAAVAALVPMDLVAFCEGLRLCARALRDGSFRRSAVPVLGRSPSRQ